jgi:hypothetical protein
LIARFSTVVVGGIELSGMSTTVVTPPDAAARVPVQKPSQSVRPGSLRCTCALDNQDSWGTRNESTMGRPDVLNKPWEEIPIARIYPVVIHDVRVVRADMASLVNRDDLSCL